MKLYQTKEHNVINLDQVVLIYRDPESNIYRLAFTNGTTYEMPELGQDDIDRIMKYNDYLIDLK